MNNSGITSEPISHLSITAILILNAVNTDSSSERRSLKPSKRALNPYFVKYTLLSSFADLTEVVYSMEFPPLLFSMPPAVGPRSQFHILLFKDISLLKVQNAPFNKKFGISFSNNGFGNKPAGSTGFSFGQNNNNTNTQPSASGFGFGGSQPNSGTATTGGFGANQATNTFGSNQQSSTGGGLFGNKPALGSLGSSSTTASGTTAAGTGLFGQQTAQPQQSTIGGGLFGNKPTTTTGGLFGNSAQNNSTTSGGLFGNKVGSTGSLMGGNSTQNTSNMNAGGLFGAKPQNTTATTGGLFGSKPQGSTTNGGLFGSGTQNNNTLGGGGLFGQSQQPQTNTAPGLGNTVSTQPSFAWSKPSTGSNLQQQQQQQIQVPLQQTQAIAQQQQLSNYPQQIQEQVLKCKESWDPNTTKTKLRAFVYNKVNETEAILYTKPGHVLQEEWDQAMEKKPSPQTIPIQIYGFEGLNQRNQVQTENVAQARIILNHILEKSTQLQQKHELDTASRILKAQSRNVEIEKRILKLGTQLATLKNRDCHCYCRPIVSKLRRSCLGKTGTFGPLKRTC
ncbi:Nucleoporin NUP57 [Saccharomyces cerevisiae]|nr:Nucleoporin NUP57 [Saccharomyces cerevisiae]